MKFAVVTQAWRVLIVAAGVTGLTLGWGPPSDMLAPLVFFTDQSNMLVAAYFTVAVLVPRYHSAWLRGAVMVYIIITGLVYHFVLATDKNPLSLLTTPVDQPASTGTFLLHYVVPLMVLIDFLLAERRGVYRWRFAASWLCYPLAYLAYALIRGAYFTVGSYPYPFLNVTKHGYRGVALNVVEYAIFFYLLGLVVVALARLVRRRASRSSAAISVVTR
jgi:hypothetical protein